MRHVLVTGAGGYIGSILTRLLLEGGHRVTAVDQCYFGRETLPPDGERLRVVQEDIRHLEIDRVRDVDAVIDLAALSNDPAGELDAEWTWQVNHAARVRVAQLARQAGVPVYLLPSSCSVYGFQDGRLDERSPVNPLTTYAKANYQAERDTLALADGRFCVVVVRQATVYGLSPRMRFDLARQAGVPVYLLPSSCSVYGFRDGRLDERSPVNPLTTYAKVNYQAERDTLALADGRFCVVVVRQATVYGLSPRMRFDLAINGMVRGLFKARKIPILRDGTQWRPFVHVRDTARAMMLLLDAPRDAIHGEVFNIGADEQNYQIMPLARLVAEAVGIEFQYEWYGVPDHRSYRVSFQKIRDTLGFNPRYTPREGALEIAGALRQKVVDPDDPRTITVGWYKHLLETGGFAWNAPAVR